MVQGYWPVPLKRDEGIGKNMQTAIYYPHTRPAGSDILRTALLLWDEVEFIVPWEGFVPEGVDRDVAEVFDVIGRESVPTDEAKRLAHERIEEFATQRLPDFFRHRAPDPGWGSPYMFARKLLPETWEMLRELGLAGGSDVARARSGTTRGWRSCRS